VLELAMRIGDLLMGSGMSANDALATMRRIFRAYAMDRVQIDITLNSIYASYYPGDGLSPVTSVRTVSPDPANLSKVAATNRLVTQITEGLPISRAMRKLDRIQKANSTYPSWIRLLAWSLVAPSVLLMYSASWLLMLLSLLNGLLLFAIMRFLSSKRVPVFFIQAAGGMLSVLVAGLVIWLQRYTSWVPLQSMRTTLIVVGGIMQLVVGTRFVGSLQDAIDGFYVTASGRVLQVLMMTGGIIIGILIGLNLMASMDIYVYLSPRMQTLGALPGQYIGAGLCAACTVLTDQANRRTTILTGVLGVLTWFVYTMVSSIDIAYNVLVGDFCAALAVAFVATALVQRTSVPGYAVIAGATIGLVPGLRLYTGLIQIVGTDQASPQVSTGMNTLGMAAGIALAIAAGASLGTFFGRPAGEHWMTKPIGLYRKIATKPSGPANRKRRKRSVSASQISSKAAGDRTSPV
jgi:uncharacterized membrane protein YjjP (DUF1212 family)